MLLADAKIEHRFHVCTNQTIEALFSDHCIQITLYQDLMAVQVTSLHDHPKWAAKKTAICPDLTPFRVESEMAVLVGGAKPLSVDSTFRESDSQGLPKLLRGEAGIQAQLKSIITLQGEGLRKNGDEVETSTIME